MAGAVPSGVVAPVADAARDTLGGATSVAAQLPAGVLDAAQVAFASGMQVVAGLAAVAMLAMAVVTAIVLRRVAPAGEPPAPDAAHGARALVAEPA